MTDSASRQASVPVIHAVTDDRILEHPEFVDRAKAVMGALGARGAVHLRARNLSAGRLYELAQQLHPSQGRTGCWLVINERLDIALASESRGAQLTSRSMSVADARRVAPELPLGASVHATHEALAAARDGATWVVAGHVFETGSHPGAPGRGVEFLAELCARAALPCIAIGGIKPQHVPALRAVGVYGIAAISGIWRRSADDAERGAIEYLSQYDTDHRPR